MECASGSLLPLIETNKDSILFFSSTRKAWLNADNSQYMRNIPLTTVKEDQNKWIGIKVIFSPRYHPLWIAMLQEIAKEAFARPEEYQNEKIFIRCTVGDLLLSRLYQLSLEVFKGMTVLPSETYIKTGVKKIHHKVTAKTRKWIATARTNMGMKEKEKVEITDAQLSIVDHVGGESLVHDVFVASITVTIIVMMIAYLSYSFKDRKPRPLKQRHVKSKKQVLSQ
jgi:hypothetical protein